MLMIFLISSRNKLFQKLSENLLTASLFSVRLCYRTIPRPLTACNPEASAVINSSAASASPCSHSARPGSLHPTHLPFILRVECWWGFAPLPWENCCACGSFGPQTASLSAGPCLEMSNAWQACLVLIVSSCVCDWCCLPECTNRHCVQSAAIHDLIF